MWYFAILALGLLDMISTELALAKGAVEANPIYPADPMALAPYLIMKFIILSVLCLMFMLYFRHMLKRIPRTVYMDAFMYAVALSVIGAYAYAVTNNFLIVFA